MQRVAIIAGRGRLPVVFAKEAQRMGFESVAVVLTPEVDPELAATVVELHQLPLGRWQTVIDTLHAMGATDVYLLGKVSKDFLFSGAEVDERFRRVLAGLSRKNDDAVSLAFVHDLEAEGFVVRPQAHLTPRLVVEEGVLGKWQPTAQEWEDIRYAYAMAKGLAGLDIGQVCVVKSGAVLAVEAIEGTDACIRRAASLAGPGVVVAKVAKPQQDARFDVPTVGPDTVRTVAEVKGRVLAVQAEVTLAIDRDELLALADDAGIAVVGYKE